MWIDLQVNIYSGSWMLLAEAMLHFQFTYRSRLLQEFVAPGHGLSELLVVIVNCWLVIIASVHWQKSASSSLLSDERFSKLFSDADFEVDITSEEYRLLNPVISNREKKHQVPVIQLSIFLHYSYKFRQINMNII